MAANTYLFCGMSVYSNKVIIAVIKANKSNIKMLCLNIYVNLFQYICIAGDDDLLDDFVHNYLRMDGLFCMRLIIKNTNDAIGKLVC